MIGQCIAFESKAAAGSRYDLPHTGRIDRQFVGNLYDVVADRIAIKIMPRLSSHFL